MKKSIVTIYNLCTDRYVQCLKNFFPQKNTENFPAPKMRFKPPLLDSVIDPYYWWQDTKKADKIVIIGAVVLEVIFTLTIIGLIVHV